MLSIVCNIFAMTDPIESVCEARLLSNYRIGSQQYVEFMNYANLLLCSKHSQYLPSLDGSNCAFPAIDYFWSAFHKFIFELGCEIMTFSKQIMF